MYYCGWDGGGTKTEVYAVDENGQTLADRCFGPLNPNGASQEKIMDTAREAIHFMASLPGGLEDCGGLVIGIAGVSNRHAAEIIENEVRTGGYHGPVRLLGDQEIALAGAIDGPGAVLIAGTGAICFGRDEAGKGFRVGGYGYLIDDGGSGYAIGRDILSSVVRCVDGRLPESCLPPLVFDFLKVKDVQGIITWLYAPATGKKEVASLAPLLLKAMEAGDEVAYTIAQNAAKDLSELVTTAWRKTGMTSGELALAGSILNRYAVIREKVQKMVSKALPDVNIHPPRGTAAQGAARLAIEYFKK